MRGHMLPSVRLWVSSTKCPTRSSSHGTLIEFGGVRALAQLLTVSPSFNSSISPRTIIPRRLPSCWTNLLLSDGAAPCRAGGGIFTNSPVNLAPAPRTDEHATPVDEDQQNQKRTTRTDRNRQSMREEEEDISQFLHNSLLLTLREEWHRQAENLFYNEPSSSHGRRKMKRQELGSVGRRRRGRVTAGFLDPWNPEAHLHKLERELSKAKAESDLDSFDQIQSVLERIEAIGAAAQQEGGLLERQWKIRRSFTVPTFELINDDGHRGSGGKITPSKNKTLACWHSNTNTIRISRDFLVSASWVEVVEVLKHEMAHQFSSQVLGADQRHETSHGPTFQFVCAQRGIDGRAHRTVTTTTSNSNSDDDDGGEFRHKTRRPFPSSSSSSSSPHSEILSGADGHASLRRAAKLLSLAQSSNQHEAEAAMNAAQKVMLQHNVSFHQAQNYFLNADRSTVGEEEELYSSPAAIEYGFRQIGPVLKRISEAHRVVAHILSKHFFVETLWIEAVDLEAIKHEAVVVTQHKRRQKRGGKNTRRRSSPFSLDDLDGRKAPRGHALEILGTKPNLDMAEYVHSWLFDTSESLWKKYMEGANQTAFTQNRRHLGLTSSSFAPKGKHRREYLSGVVHGFLTKLNKQKEKVEAEAEAELRRRSELKKTKRPESPDNNNDKSLNSSDSSDKSLVLKTDDELNALQAVISSGDEYLKKYFKKRHPRVRSIGGGGGSQRGDAFHKGVQDGKGLVLNRGMHTRGSASGLLLDR